MTSLNGDGSKIQQDSKTAKHTGYCIEVTDVVTDARLECHPLAANGEGLLPVPIPPEEPEAPIPDVANLIFRWSATSPLLSLEGSDYAFTHNGVISEKNGRDALVLADSQSLQNATPDTIPLGDISGERTVVYQLGQIIGNGGVRIEQNIFFSSTGGGTPRLLLQASSQVGITSSIFQYNNGAGYNNAIGGQSLGDPSQFVVAGEWRGDTTDDTLVSVNKVRAGSPTAVGNPTNSISPVNFLAIGNSVAAPAESAIWEILVFKGVPFNPDTVDWLRDLIGLPPA